MMNKSRQIIILVFLLLLVGLLAALNQTVFAQGNGPVIYTATYNADTDECEPKDVFIKDEEVWLKLENFPEGLYLHAGDLIPGIPGFAIDRDSAPASFCVTLGDTTGLEPGEYEAIVIDVGTEQPAAQTTFTVIAQSSGDDDNGGGEENTSTPAALPNTGSPSTPIDLIVTAASLLVLSGASLGIWFKRRK